MAFPDPTILRTYYVLTNPRFREAKWHQEKQAFEVFAKRPSLEREIASGRRGKVFVVRAMNHLVAQAEAKRCREDGVGWPKAQDGWREHSTIFWDIPTKVKIRLDVNSSSQA